MTSRLDEMLFLRDEPGWSVYPARGGSSTYRLVDRARLLAVCAICHISLFLVPL